jgi:hypothetical protein
MPMDAHPVGGFVINDDSSDPNDPPKLTSIRMYNSHFATCPNADQHRKSR